VAPGARRAACVLNARGRMAPTDSRRSRGVLPLQAAEDGKLSRAGLAGFDPFHLLSAEPGVSVLWSWDGDRLAERELSAGLHIVVNSGLDSDLRAAHEHERARIAHFLPRLRAAARPVPRPGGPTAQAWGTWLPLLTGDGLAPDDPRALIVRRDRPGLGDDVGIAGRARAGRAALRLHRPSGRLGRLVPGAGRLARGRDRGHLSGPVPGQGAVGIW